MNMKGYLYLCLCFCSVCFYGCIQSDIANEQKKTSQKDKYIADNLLQNIIKANKEWFESWDWIISDLSSIDFHQDWRKEMKLYWVEYDPEGYFSDSLLIEFGDKAIDMYSYSMVLNQENGNVSVEFDVDSKIYLLDKTNHLLAELVVTGSYEIIEDALWLDSSTVCLLGYINETEMYPFIWFFEIDKELQIFYKFQEKGFKGDRQEYFIVKYPNVVIR